MGNKDNEEHERIVIVAHASEQTEQWFNEGSLRTFLWLLRRLA